MGRLAGSVAPGVGSPIYVAGRDWVLSSRVGRKPTRRWAECPTCLISKCSAGRRTAQPARRILSIEPQRKMRFDLGRSVSLNDTTQWFSGRWAFEKRPQWRRAQCRVSTMWYRSGTIAGHDRRRLCVAVVLGGRPAIWREASSRATNKTTAWSPLIPLGTVATSRSPWEVGNWQVVGYQERCDQPADPEEETTFWREYLLYNQKRGFVGSG